MPEPVSVSEHSIVISPDSPPERRTWPNPVAASELAERATHNPQRLTPDDIRQLARIASTYCYIFEVPQRTFLPTHAAIRAHFADQPERT